MEVFFYGFMQRAFQASTLIAMIAPILGLTLILRRQSLLADTLSHVSLAGIALGMLIGINPTFTTIFVVILVAIGIEYLQDVFQGYSEISIAILMSTGMAIALVLMSFVSGQQTANIEQFLFGSIVTIDKDQITTLLVLTVVVVALYVIFNRPLYVLLFDEATAATAGLPVRQISLFISVITGVAISLIMPITGSLLVSAILVLPSAIAMRLVNSFKTVILLGTVIALIGMYGGLYLSYDLGTPPGATITLMFVLIFVITGIFKRIQTKLK
ncbi:High-affinity zinc uptake system membrane protein ZnuB [Jeotgalibaca dankookensis]|uniref:High-affinity zinc uptake system membrane protein ZnuB n=1 Tax=Jeotgalibaca dankookensis TaxID=708126 RepID=A0A1S6IQQ8_9LACT|nr:metal ABC transporter permease [Jeotgalibaca dankookensis]AQS53859.1 High-affinity zinc uptake system membrane protein ZnuB [Jeotgalibaca dankookensis]